MEVLALWGLFAGLVLGTLIVDLLVFNKKPHVMHLPEASLWCGIWVSLAAAFGVRPVNASMREPPPTGRALSRGRELRSRPSARCSRSGQQEPGCSSSTRLRTSAAFIAFAGALVLFAAFVNEVAITCGSLRGRVA